MNITVNFEKITGKIKPMHGVGQPPYYESGKHMHYLSEAGIPCSRLHDVGGVYGAGRFVDIHNIFRDFDADETIPESYDFTFTDKLITSLIENNVKPFFRLGETIENDYNTKAYYIYAPKDYEKWARICEHIIRHYNEGWADGFHYGIEYWEIWGEPEGHKHGQHGPLWIGTKEEFFRLYEVTSNHLKKCFGDSIKIGGYSTCDFAMFDAFYEDPDCVGIEGPYKKIMLNITFSICTTSSNIFLPRNIKALSTIFHGIHIVQLMWLWMRQIIAEELWQNTATTTWTHI